MAQTTEFTNAIEELAILKTASADYQIESLWQEEAERARQKIMDAVADRICAAYSVDTQNLTGETKDKVSDLWVALSRAGLECSASATRIHEHGMRK